MAPESRRRFAYATRRMASKIIFFRLTRRMPLQAARPSDTAARTALQAKMVLYP